MLDKHIWCVIMAGGSGTRFWPISTQQVPKQFVAVDVLGKSFLQVTRSRFDNLIPPERTIVVTNRKYGDMVREHLPEIPAENIIEEPYNRDTAPCVALATYTILKRDPNAIMVVVPSDHLIFEKARFHEIVSYVTAQLADRDALVTIGTTPTRPETNYGYIQTECIPTEDSFVKVKTFTEKPDAELAKVFISSGEFLWNSGIFIWKADTIRHEIERYLPRVADLFNGWEGALDTPSAPDFLNKVYADIQKISIDYGIMEHTENAWTYVANFGWYDIGTTESLYSFYPGKDRDENASNCPTMLQNSHRNLMVSTNKEKLIAVCGLDDYAVVDTADVLMVCPRNDKKIREFLSNLALPEYSKYR